MKKIKNLYERVEDLFFNLLSKGLTHEEEYSELFLELFVPLKEEFKKITIINPTIGEKRLYRKLKSFFDFSEIDFKKIKDKETLFFKEIKNNYEKIPMKAIMEEIEEFEEKFEDFPRT